MRHFGRGVNIDVKEVHNFAIYLNEYNSELREMIRILQGEYQKLKETWKDESFWRYSKIYEDSILEINEFLKNSSQYSAYLQNIVQRGRNNPYL